MWGRAADDFAEPDRIWILTVVIAAAFFALGVGQRVFGEPTPGLPNQVVDADAFQRCLEAADPALEKWSVTPVGADYIGVDWQHGSGAGLSVLPTRADALEMADRLTISDGSGESETHTWANVVMRYSTYRSSPPDAAKKAIYDCSEDAAVPFAPADAGFSDCDGSLANRAIDDSYAVRGISCADGRALAQQFFGKHNQCSESGYLCTSINICCAIFADYIGNRDQAVVFKTGI